MGSPYSTPARARGPVARDAPHGASWSLRAAAVELQPFPAGRLGQALQGGIDLGFRWGARLLPGHALLDEPFRLPAPITRRETPRECGVIPDPGILRMGLRQGFESVVGLLVTTLAEEAHSPSQ